MAKTKKDFQSEQSRAAILSATMGLISKHGFNGTTIDKVAAEAGLSKGSIFWHFENKENLFRAVVEALRNSLLEGLLEGLSEGLSAKEKIVLMLDNYASQIEKDCSGCIDITVLIIEMVETNPHMADELRDLFEQLTGYLALILDEGKKQGEIDAALDSRMTAYAIVGNLEGLTVQYYLNRNRVRYGQLMGAYKNLVLNGLFSA
jgi:TetR/AcrR family acrAB operon transcriptional repressor